MILNKYKLQLVKESAKSYPEYDRKLVRPEEVASLLFDLEVDKEPIESFYLLMLDVRLKLIGLIKLATGTASQAIVDGKSIMQAALLANAHAIMLSHNHPSGDPEPSPADYESTMKIKEISEVMQIQLLDHIIIGHDRKFISFRERGLIS